LAFSFGDLITSSSFYPTTEKDTPSQSCFSSFLSPQGHSQTRHKERETRLTPSTISLFLLFSLSSGDDRPSARENTLLLGELVARSLRDNVETEAEEVEEHSTVGDDVGEVNDLWVRMGQDREEHRVSSEKGKGESESRGEIVMRK
jgi:hypothetical protein